MKSYFTSKTMWASFVLGIVGVIQMTMADAPLDPQLAGAIGIGLGAVMAVLRNYTTKAVGKGGGGIANVSLVFLVCVCLLAFPGCTGMAGTSSVPRLMVYNGDIVLGADGSPVVAYTKFKGVGGAFGQASIGDNIEGGPISVPGAGIFMGALELVARVIGGFFTGFGAAGAAISPDDD